MKNYLSKVLIIMAAAGVGTTVTADAQNFKDHATGMFESQVSLATTRARVTDPRRPFIQKAATPQTQGMRRAGVNAPVVRDAKGMPSKAASDEMPDLCGSVVYSTEFSSASPAVGLYRLPKSDREDIELMFLGPDAQGGGVYADGRYYSTYFLNLANYYIVTVSEWDVVTATQVMEYEGNVTNIPLAGSAVDPLTGDIYGIFLNEQANGYAFGKISYTPTVVTTPIADLPGTWNAMAIDRDGRIYGISLQANVDQTTGAYEVTGSYLNLIDRNTGAVTRIGATGERPQYNSSACIDPISNRMFWNVSHIDSSSNLCEVDLATGKATPLYDFAHNEVVMGMYADSPKAAAKAPGACTDMTVSFDNGSLSGNVSFKTPARLFDGSFGTGELTVKVIANGKELASRTAGFGETVSMPVSVDAAGLYDFTVYASNAAGYGPMNCEKGVYVGNDTPAATTATLKNRDNELTLSWLPVEASVNGGYIDYSKVTYRITRYPGRKVVAEDFVGTEFTETLPEPAKITAYHYSVVAKYDGRESAPALSNSVILGALTPPYSSNFAGNDMNDWMVTDNNADGFTWMSTQEGTVMISYNTNDNTVGMDDWLMSPPLKLQAGKSYVVSFQAYAKSATYPEILEVKYGRGSSISDMTNTLVEPTEIRALAGSPMYFEQTIEPDADGNYCIGFHAMSKANSYYLYLTTVMVDGGISINAPGEPLDFTVTPDADGDLKADISFKAPQTTIKGNPLTSIDRIELARNEEVIKTFEGVTPGQSLTFTDRVDISGEYTYTATAYNADGTGLRATAMAFLGVDLPGIVYNVNLVRTATEGEVTLTWDAVDKDQYDRPVSAKNITYSVYEYYSANDMKLLAEGLTETSYTYQAIAAGKQDFVQCVVAAKTISGIGRGSLSPMIAAGKPYTDFRESFAGGQATYNWALESILGGDVRLYTDATFPNLGSQDADNGYVGVFAVEAGTGASMVSGLISLENAVNPAFSIWTYNLKGSNVDNNEVCIEMMPAESSKWTQVYSGTVDQIAGGVAGWAKLTVPLDSYKGRVIQVRVTGISGVQSYTLFDNIRVGSTYATDLNMQMITAPAGVTTGTTFAVDARISNDGTAASPAYKVVLYADGEAVAEKEMPSLASESVATAEFEAEMSPLAKAGVFYHAEIVCKADENSANNSSTEIEVKPVQSPLPAVKDLAGHYAEGNVALNWTAPDLDAAPMPVTCDFEDGSAFADSYGDWIFYDGDMKAVGGIKDTPLPGITSGSTTGSFWVWDTDVVGRDNVHFMAHSGKKFLFALYRYDDNSTDDWAISPELCGDAQQISFFAKSYSAQYPEQIDIYYSTGGTAKADFTLIRNAAGKVPADWTLYTVDLPAGAKRFAIRSHAVGSLMLMVDDVTFTPASVAKDAVIEGYDVYRDGSKVASSETAGWTDSSVDPEASYTYVVVTRYNKGLSAASNEAVVSTSGIGSVTVDEADAEYYNLQGIRVDKPEGGIYIRRTGTRATKILK